MVRGMNRAILLVFLVLIAGNVFANFAFVKLEMVSGELMVTDVRDDDNDIEMVDVFVSNVGLTRQFSFIDVVDGQILPIEYDSESTVSYNFNDTDGDVFGLGTFLIVQTGAPPDEPIPPERPPQFIDWVEFVPRLAPGNSGFFVEVRMKVKDEYNDDNLRRSGLDYGINSDSLNNSDIMTSGSQYHYKNLGPFTGKLYIRAKVTARYFDPEKGLLESSVTKKHYFELLLPSDNACNVAPPETGYDCSDYSNGDPRIKGDVDGDGDVDGGDADIIGQMDVGLIPIPDDFSCLDMNDDGVIGTVDVALIIRAAGLKGKEETEEKVLFSDFSGFSFLRISISEEGNLRASEVFDDDASIGNVDIFYILDGDVTQNSFVNVAEGQDLGSVPPEAESSWFNYFDSDGSIANIAVFNQFVPEQGAPPDNPPGPARPSYIGEIEFFTEMSENEQNFELTVEVGIGRDEPDSMTLFYKVDDGGLREVELEREGGVFAASLGFFDGRFFVTGHVSASGERGNQTSGFVPGWFALVQKSELECVELCEDEIDNDGDGLINEGCVELAELYFSRKTVPSYSITDNPIKGSLTVKNSGVVISPGFNVEYYFNNELLSSSFVESLDVDEDKEIFFEIPYSDELEGDNDFRAVIDPNNNVSELVESNNEYEQVITVGPNFFNVEMNYNETYFPGDFREIQVRDALERVVKDANVVVSLPNGEETRLLTDRDGIVKLQLPSGGDFGVNVTKADFIPFNGRFNVSELFLPFLDEVVVVGAEQDLRVQNREGRQLGSGTLQISQPGGGTLELDLNSTNLASFLASQRGNYALRLVRNGLIVLQSDFLATGIIESVLLGPGSLFDLLFGPTAQNPLLLLLLLILALLSAYFVYNKAPVFFRKGAKSTRDKQIEQAIRFGLAFVYFVMPFQFDRLFGFNAALLSIFLEVAVILVGEYYVKEIKTKRKAIKVK